MIKDCGASAMYDMLVVLGPTATGKTSLAAHWAARHRGEIISADSRQIYRGMTIGTGKDLADYEVCIPEAAADAVAAANTVAFGDGQHRVVVPHHLVDIVEAGYRYNVFEFQRDFLKAYEDIRSRAHVPVLCGGSGMYLEAVLSGYRLISVPPDKELRARLSALGDEELASMLSSLKPLHNHSDTENRKRLLRAVEIAQFQRDHPGEASSYPLIRSLLVGIDFDREVRRKRITERLHQRLQEGLVGEVEALLAKGLLPEDLEYYGLEYKFLSYYLTGRLSRQEMTERLNVAIHQFAKRQMTWFRKMERDGFDIHWIDGTLTMEEKLARMNGLFFR